MIQRIVARARKAVLDYGSIYIGKLIELGGFMQEKDVLDVGCGWGRIATGLKEFCPHLDIKGLEINRERLRSAKGIVGKGNNTTHWIRGDATNLPLRNDAFDLVYAIRVLHYLEDSQKALKEFARVCKKGGSIIVFQPNKRNILYGLVYMLAGGFSKRFFSPKKAVELFENAGLSDVKWGSIGFIPLSKRNYNSRILSLEYLAQKIPFLNSFGSILYTIGKNEGNCYPACSEQTSPS